MHSTELPNLFGSNRGSSRQTRSLELIVRKSEPRGTAVFDTYWKFATERQSIFHARAAGRPGPWTDDPVLREYKFTNAYRAADRVSQNLIRKVIYARGHDWRSTFLRILLFKIFNKIETWELIESQVERVTADTFALADINSILDRALAQGVSIYSGAYIMPSGPRSIRRPRKHLMHLTLLSELMKKRFADKVIEARTMKDAYERLLQIPSFGPFLAFQFLIDLNYSSYLSFSEMDFVVPGPGARDGIRKCFYDLGDYSETDVIRWVTERQESEFTKRDLNFPSLWGRPLHLIDCQNLFCEVDKYARVVHPDVKGVSGRARIKQRFSPQRGGIELWFPPKWGINEQIATSQAAPGPSRE